MSTDSKINIVFHHIYEFKKGIRSLVLCTLCNHCSEIVKDRLQHQGIDYCEQRIGSNKVNLFFGKKECLEVVGNFIHKPLNLLSPEEDFILGVMLGYDINMQCSRFNSRKMNQKGKVVSAGILTEAQFLN